MAGRRGFGRRGPAPAPRARRRGGRPRGVRERGGGLPAGQALGLPLASRRRVQVSMNLVDYKKTPIPAAFDRVSAEARRRGVAIERAELVGLAPRAAFAGRDPASVGLEAFRPDHYLDVWM